MLNTNDDMAVLCYIYDYVAKKAYRSKKYEESKAFVISEDTIQLEIDKEFLKYIDDLNRGGLLYPSNILFKVIQIVHDIFNLCVSKYEINFTKCTYEKNVILAISIEYISKNDDELMEIYEICTYCHSDTYSMIKKGLSVNINILLNNYRKLKSDVNKKNIYKLAKF